MEILMKIAKFVDEGGAVEYLILGLLGLGFSVIFERVWFFFIKCRVNSKKLMADVTALIRKDKVAEARKLCNQTGTPLGLIMEAGIWKYEQSATAEEVKDALEEVALREVPRLQKRTTYLGLLANLCTLVGLLGTIFGLQEAFAALESAESVPEKQAAGPRHHPGAERNRPRLDFGHGLHGGLYLAELQVEPVVGANR